MGKLIRDLNEHLKDISGVLVLVFIFLGFVVLIFGGILGYDTVTWIGIGLALLVTIIFASIVLGEVLLNLIVNLFRRLFDRAE
jgi:hypothetical protein